MALHKSFIHSFIQVLDIIAEKKLTSNTSPAENPINILNLIIV